MKALVATKIGMTQSFGPDGQLVPVTLLQAMPCVVTQLRSQDKDGYRAVQVGYGESTKLGKAQAGHLKAAGSKSRKLKEFRLEGETDLAVGAKLAVDQFEAGERVTVSAVSKGKGFAGTIKRWNFHRGPMTHGSKNKRRPGSIGSMYPQKVWKGKHMAGRLGHAKVTLRKVLISEIDKDNNLVAVKGAVPGARGGTVLLEAK